MRKRILALALILSIAVALAPSALAAGGAAIENFGAMARAEYVPGQFSDVDENEWYGANAQAAVKTAYELRIVNGKGGGVFDPNGSVLLCEAIKMAAVVCDIYEGGSGEISSAGYDAGAPWYAPYADYCIERGVIGADDFGGDYTREATRAEMAYIFANALPADELFAINNVVSIPDVAESSPYYDEILALYRCGALQGNNEYGEFTPDADITRAAAAAIISRIALPERRLIFSLKAPAAAVGYTPGMYVEDLETLQRLYTERVWGLYADMSVRMSDDMARKVWDMSDVYQQWVPMAADVYFTYDPSDGNLMSYELKNYDLFFSLRAVIADGGAAARASDDAKGCLAEIDAILEKLDLRRKSETERLLAIHDWMAANLAYDLSFAEPSFSLKGALENGTAVCQGYAELLCCLASRAGVSCECVYGTASSGAGYNDWESHAWNVVYLTGDQTPYYIDVTFDDPLPDTAQGRHDYFMITAEVLAKDHIW